MKSIRIVLFSLLLLITEHGFTQKNIVNSLDSISNRFITERCFNGDILVSVNNKQLYRKAIGFKDIETKEEIKSNSIFNIGSISKPFTSIAILQLQEKGLLNINEPVIKYLPEFPYKNILIKHLLSHTSGIKQSINQIEEFEFNSNVNNDSLLAIFVRYKPALFAEPGTDWIYSNIGYEFLGLILEKVSKMSFQEYMSINIFEPAGMKRTFIPVTRNIASNLPKGVTKKDLLVPHEYKKISDCEVQHVDSVNFVQTRKEFLFGSENVYSCVNDMVKFDEALRTNKILSKEMQELAYTPFVLSKGDTAKDMNAPIPSYFGMGWYISINKSQDRIIWHKGRSRGSRSVFLRVPSKEQVVIVTDNFDYTAVDLKGIALLRSLNNQAYRNPVLMSLVQKLGCETNTIGAEKALYNFENRKATQRKNYYVSEEETIELCGLLMEDKKLQEVKIILKHAEIWFPKSSEVNAMYARIMFNEGKLDSSSIYWARAVSYSADNEKDKESYLNWIGYGYLMSNELTSAEFVLKLNTELFPNSANVYDSYAQALEKSGKLIEAMQIQEKAVNIATSTNDPLLEAIKENLNGLRTKKGISK